MKLNIQVSEEADMKALVEEGTGGKEMNGMFTNMEVQDDL